MPLDINKYLPAWTPDNEKTLSFALDETNDSDSGFEF